MAKITALARGNTALSLGLTGVPVEELRNQEQVEERLSELLESDLDVVMVAEEWRSGFSEWMNNRLARHGGRPLVIYCPAFDEEDPGTDAYINAIVKPAVGFEIRLD
jgi:hypothetical protein